MVKQIINNLRIFVQKSSLSTSSITQTLSTGPDNPRDDANRDSSKEPLSPHPPPPLGLPPRPPPLAPS